MLEIEPVEFLDSAQEIAIVMTTCWRPEQYIIETLNSLEKAGLHNWRGPKILVCDGYDVRGRYPTKGWEVHGMPGQPKTGFNSTVLRAWHFACATGVSKILHIEDECGLFS